MNVIKKIIKKLGRKQLSDKTAVNDLLPTNEEQLKTMMFSAYLTGQTDIINKHMGLGGRSFASWYRDNYNAKQLRSQQNDSNEKKFSKKEIEMIFNLLSF
jgi:hypothetical protein